MANIIKKMLFNAQYDLDDVKVNCCVYYVCKCLVYWTGTHHDQVVMD